MSRFSDSPLRAFAGGGAKAPARWGPDWSPTTA
ncbi:MAG: hypothetical protein QOH40_3078, partial [Arthrobacter pascens]|nr:hypothetical protein [Arthrobacter pascens]